MIAQYGLDLLNDHQREPAAVFKAAAEFIGAEVGQRREELTEQIPGGSADLHCVKARFHRPARTGGIVLQQVKNLLTGHLRGSLPRIGGEGCRGGQGIAAAGNVRLGHIAPRMVELYGDLAAPVMHALRKFLPAGDGGIVRQRHGVGLCAVAVKPAGADDDQPCAALHTLPVVFVEAGVA